MRIVKHMVQQPFVFATGAAALIHSTWALGTLFAGEQPEGWALLGWIAPALLISFALDVGQIATSAEIREHGLTRTRGVTFIVFSGATYYLQWLYIAHHMPALALAEGVRETWASFATVMRDSAVWIIPALLPLSTLLYTFSGGQGATARHAATAPPVPIASNPAPAVPIPELQAGLSQDIQSGEVIQSGDVWIARDGTWEREYTTLASAQRGLAGHRSYLQGQAARVE